jgi:hypothetical protein
MKNLRTFVLSGMAVSFIFISCQKEEKKMDTLQSRTGAVNTTSCLNYSVTLSRTFASNQTTFVWTITNPRPGNGSNGTTQDLSHWSFVPGCPGNNGLEQNWSDIVSASYSYDGGATWATIVPTPILKPDPSQTCSSANVFKFDFGTSGSTPTMYKLVLSGNYSSDAANYAVFKSGAKTGCCTRTIPGIGCKVEQTCTYSQGYYFGSPHPWAAPGTVTIAGFTYSEAEGRAIWDCSNAGGIRDAKKGFTQVAALVLSGAYPTGNPSIDADVLTVVNWLATKGKLVACTNLPNQTNAEISAYGNVSLAAGRIGQWIADNHCLEPS